MEPEVYCICRSTDISRFMIGCDKCDEWYHGDCIDVSAEDASVIKKYFCNKCRNQNPGLKIKYKRKYREQLMSTQPHAVSTKSDNEGSIKSATTSPVSSAKPKSQPVKEPQKVEKDKAFDTSLSFSKVSEKSDSKKESHKSSNVLASILSVKPEEKEISREKESTSRDERKTSDRGIGGAPSKERKLRPEDAILKDKPFKLGKSDAEKNLEKLLQAQLLKTSEKMRDDKAKLLSKAEPDKTSLTASTRLSKDSKRQESNANSSNDKAPTVVKQESKMDPLVVKIDDKVLLSKEQKQPGSKPTVTIRDDEKSKNNAAVSIEVEAKQDECSKAILTSNFEENSEYSHRRKKKRKYMEDESYARASHHSDNKHMQCYGPGCVNKSRKTSKYCSDDCGMALARQRLLTLLPERIADWRRNPPIANEKDRIELDRIRSQKNAVLARVKELDIERQDLENEISAARNLVPLQEDDADSEDISGSGSDIFCFICAHQLSSSTALKHIEKCFAKIETQTSYESKYPSNIPMLFCDAYNNRTKSFCKRLKIICPEHSAKDYKVGEFEVCGCPLPNPGEVIYDDKIAHEYCRVLKRKCSKHYKWEVMRIATIDAERVNNLIKYDELLEAEARTETSLKTRGSVMDLLLNSVQAH